MNREPLLTRAAVVGFVTALLGLLVAFGVELSKEQVAAILVFVAAAGPVVTALLARRKVTPVDSPNLSE